MFCGNNEIRFLPTAGTSQRFLTPKLLAIIEGDGYSLVENQISTSHYHMKTSGVISRESLAC